MPENIMIIRQINGQKDGQPAKFKEYITNMLTEWVSDVKVQRGDLLFNNYNAHRK